MSLMDFLLSVIFGCIGGLVATMVLALFKR